MNNMEKPLREKLFGAPMTLREKIEKLKEEEAAKTGTVPTPTIKPIEEPGADKLRGDSPIKTL